MFASILAVVAFILGITLDQPVLFVIAGVLLLIVIGSLIWMWRRRRTQRRQKPEQTGPTDDESLEELGIMEIRQKRKEPSPASDVAEENAAGEKSSQPAEVAPEEKEKPPSSGEPAEQPPPVEQSRPPSSTTTEATEESAPSSEPPAAAPSDGADVQEVTRSPEESTADAPTSSQAAAPPAGTGKDVLTPFLRSIQAAVQARTVCLLKQEDLALEYEVQALVSAEDRVQQSGTFSTRTPLLTAGMTQRDVTVQRVGEMALPPECLAYYEEPSGLRQVMIAPVERPDEPASYFLLADTAKEGGFNAERPRSLMARFANLLAVLLEREEAERDEPPQTTRPRREIIQEEMEAARSEDRPLTLALVYLNRAEALADEGKNAVAAAERALEERLQQSAEPGRVERFGELTYGIFYPAAGEEAETWAMQLQSDLDKERGRLEGGVSIGVAVLGERHETPDAFRADATEALREAYTTGTCTILE